MVHKNLAPSDEITETLQEESTTYFPKMINLITNERTYVLWAQPASQPGQGLDCECESTDIAQALAAPHSLELIIAKEWES